MSTLPAIDRAKMDAFVHRVFGDTSSTTTTVLAAIGDRLGLFKELAARGPATSAELAERAGVNERYTREWLGGMASAGYLEYEPASRRFSLPPEHAPALADEAGPVFFGGIYQTLLGNLQPLEQIVHAFQHGGGVPQSAYPDSMYDGLDRFSAGWHENLLLQQWLPAVPDVQAKLERGAEVADVGCGRGRALLKLAQAFPRSRYVGYDVFEPNVVRAAANAELAGVTNRVRFEQRDVSQGLPEQYDLITTFDVIHDAVDPLGLLSAIRQGLKPDGTYLCLDVNCSENLEENSGPLGAMFHGFSILYCMTTSLANGGEGLGTLGLPECKLVDLCSQAGFSSVRRLPLDNPFNNLYEVRP
ncbi:MAG: methyltransferase domain-containing protein [Chloroflexi bacterium]|nr:methyltransferase domain-containing protein [Chloroflexota bacterium]